MKFILVTGSETGTSITITTEVLKDLSESEDSHNICVITGNNKGIDKLVKDFCDEYKIQNIVIANENEDVKINFMLQACNEIIFIEIKYLETIIKEQYPDKTLCKVI